MAAPWSSTGLLTGNKAEEFGKGSTYALRGKMTSSSPTETATTYTIPSVKLSTVLSKTSSESFTLAAQSISSVYVGVSIGGTTKLEYSGTSITGTKSGSIAIAKTHQSQSVTLSLRFNYVGDIVASYSDGSGWSDFYSNSGLPVYGSHTFTVPAKTHYTVSYNANSGSGAPSAQTKWHGETLTLSSTKPTRTGYTFLGWSTSSTATSATYAAGGSYTANAAATLYAVWRINTWTVAYNANGGTGAPASQTKTYGQTLTLSSSRPSRSGYTFLGWSTNSAGTGTAYSPGGSYTANAAATLYAVWVAVQVTSLSAYRSNSAGTRSDSGTYGHLSAGWKAMGTIAGTVAVTATANDASVTSSLSNRSGSKTATDDLSNTSVGTFGGSYAQDAAVRVSVTATLTVSYGGSSRSVSATRVATIPKVFRLLDALHGGTGLAIGAIATLANTFEVALTTLFQNVVEVVQSNITRDGTYTEPANGDHQIRLVDSSRRILSYLSAHKAANSSNNYLRLTAYGPSGSKTANVYISASDTAGYLSTDCVWVGGIVSDTSAHVIKDTRFDRDGANPSSNLWSTVHSIQDKDGENLCYLQAYQTTDGGVGMNLWVTAEDTDSTEHNNHIRIWVGKNGNRAYSVGDAAAFRSAINAQVAGSYATTNNAGAINTAGGNGNHFLVGGMVTSEGTYKGHRTFLAMSENGIFGWDGTGEKTIWTLPITRTTSTTAITAASGVTITKQEITRRSNVVMLRVQATIAAAKSANTSVTIGTVASGWRPAMDIFAGVWAVGSWDGYVSSSGAIVVRPKASTSANTVVVVSATYVLA